MTTDELKHRTKTFAVETIKFAKSLPNDVATHHISGQLVRCGTAVGSNYRASCRAKSRADFVSKMTTVEEEADETRRCSGWKCSSIPTPFHEKPSRRSWTKAQLLRIFVASIKTARGGRR